MKDGLHDLEFDLPLQIVREPLPFGPVLLLDFSVLVLTIFFRTMLWPYSLSMSLILI